MSFRTELIVDVQAEEPGDAVNLRFKVEQALMEVAGKLPKGSKVWWFCSKTVEKVPEKSKD